MMRNQFDSKLEELNANMIRMGAMIETAISQSISALKTGDRTLAQQVMESDGEVDELELEIERKSLMILLTEQPVAKDLRSISTALKMITDMERISDQAVDIAEIVLSMPQHRPHLPKMIICMAQKCVIMVSESISSFIEGDVQRAQRVIDADDEIDTIFEQIKVDLLAMIRADEQGEIPVLDYLMIAKYLERIADHSTNIAEWVQFGVTGTHKNHRIL